MVAARHEFGRFSELTEQKYYRGTKGVVARAFVLVGVGLSAHVLASSAGPALLIWSICACRSKVC